MDAETTIPARDLQYAPHGNYEKPDDGQKRLSVDIDEKSMTQVDETEVLDLFTSFPLVKGIEPEPSPLTARAVLTGIVLGSLVNASNVYLGKSLIL